MEPIKHSVDYDAVASTYDRRYTDNEYGDVERALLKFVNKSDGGRVLEVGCGTGYWLEVLANQGLAVAGLDSSKKMISHAQTRLPNTPIVYGRAESIPWQDGSFDIVFCINSFHHFKEKKKFLSEAHRVLNKGGGIMIIGLDPHTGLDHWWIYDYYPQVLEIDKKRYPPTEALRNWMRQVGFNKCRSEVVLHFPIEVSARAALEEGKLSKVSTSQLTLLDDTEYESGIRQLMNDIEASEARHEEFIISADLRLFMTVGWV